MADQSLAIILGNNTIRLALANFAKSVIYSTAPSIPVVASIKASYKLIASDQSEEVMPFPSKLRQYQPDVLI